jgi:hypothetical protein
LIFASLTNVDGPKLPAGLPIGAKSGPRNAHARQSPDASAFGFLLHMPTFERAKKPSC